MTIELLSLLGGAVGGFVLRFMSAQAEAQASHFDRVLRAQVAADASHDAAKARSGSTGVWVRRGLAMAAVFATIIAPFIIAFTGVGVTVEGEQAWWDIFGVFTGSWETLEGFVLLPEVRQVMVAITGYYLGSSAVRRP